MLLLRYRGEQAARSELARHAHDHQDDPRALRPELIFEAADRGRLKVRAPVHGAWAFAKSDLISWGLFGLVYGLIIGIVSNHGVFSTVKDTAGGAIVCAVFGLAAGALYGLWAGRGVSARRPAGRPAAAAVRQLKPPRLVRGGPHPAGRRQLVPAGSPNS